MVPARCTFAGFQSWTYESDGYVTFDVVGTLGLGFDWRPPGDGDHWVFGVLTMVLVARSWSGLRSCILGRATIRSRMLAGDAPVSSRDVHASLPRCRCTPETAAARTLAPSLWSNLRRASIAAPRLSLLARRFLGDLHACAHFEVGLRSSAVSLFVFENTKICSNIYLIKNQMRRKRETSY